MFSRITATVRKLVRTPRVRTSLLAAAVGVVALAVVLGLAAGAGRAAPSPSVARTLVAQAHGRLEAGFQHTAHTASLCGQVAGLVCTQVVVPLDRTGAVPGSISLHVEELPASGTPKGVMFLIAGGPGQGSAYTFGLGDANADALYRYLFPGYTLVAYDDRGTGNSGLLDCPALQTANTAQTEKAAAAACGAALGTSAPFYSTAEHAADLDAVRAVLGFDKVGLWGVSYGTKLAMAYALGFPAHVDRLLLDSVLPPELPDPYESNVLQNLPTTLAGFCSTGGCNGTQFANDVVAVANRLAAKPLVGKVATGHGAKTLHVDGLDFLSTVLDADLSPGEAADLPAVTHAARVGNTQPLLRISLLHSAGAQESSIDLSSALYAATVCRDGPFPWDPNTAPAARPPLLQQAIASSPPGTFGQFGPWAAAFGNADFCTGWPSPTGNAPLGVGPLPNVPMLAVSGSFDMRTPTNGAQSVVTRFPQGRLLLVPGVGHSTVTADPSGCAVNGVRTWITTGTPPASCPVTPPLVVPVPPLPAPSKHVLTARATYAAAKATVADAQAIWLMTAGASGAATAIPGIFGGQSLESARSFKLVNYTVTRGVTVSGTLTFKKFGTPLVFQGAVTVGGANAQHGLLGLNGASLRGTLGGRSVG
jgi:pimeloyl-ACP methyl ester carboxylesterase